MSLINYNQLDKTRISKYLPIKKIPRNIEISMSYKNIINYIKAKIPKAAISGDAIVAFPGESETDYEQTLSLRLLPQSRQIPSQFSEHRFLNGISVNNISNNVFFKSM